MDFFLVVNWMGSEEFYKYDKYAYKLITTYWIIKFEIKLLTSPLKVVNRKL